MATERNIIVRNEVGLHARPAASFVKTAARFKSKITIENLTKGRSPANAKSILSVLTCGVTQNDEIRLLAEGTDETEAVAALVDLIENDFAED